MIDNLYQFGGTISTSITHMAKNRNDDREEAILDNFIFDGYTCGGYDDSDDDDED